MFSLQFHGTQEASMFGEHQTLPLLLGRFNVRKALLRLPHRCGNDPSAGSPTETLLRLHLPLNDEI